MAAAKQSINYKTYGLEREVTKWGRGELPKTWNAGDVGVVEFGGHSDFLDSMIQARERVTCGKTPWANVDHTFCVVSDSGGIVEANAGGIEYKQGQKYLSDVFWIISPKVAQDKRDLCIEYWLRQVGDEYGYTDFIFTQAPKAIFGWETGLHTNHQQICSELGCNGHLKLLPEFQYDASVMTPADILMFWDVDMGVPVAPMGFPARFWDKVVFFGHIFAKALKFVFGTKILKRIFG